MGSGREYWKRKSNWLFMNVEGVISAISGNTSSSLSHSTHALDEQRSIDSTYIPWFSLQLQRRDALLRVGTAVRGWSTVLLTNSSDAKFTNGGIGTREWDAKSGGFVLYLPFDNRIQGDIDSIMSVRAISLPPLRPSILATMILDESDCQLISPNHY